MLWIVISHDGQAWSYPHGVQNLATHALGYRMCNLYGLRMKTHLIYRRACSFYVPKHTSPIGLPSPLQLKRTNFDHVKAWSLFAAMYTTSHEDDFKTWKAGKTGAAHYSRAGLFRIQK